MLVLNNVDTRITIKFIFYSYVHHRDLHSFPTRRSSDLSPRVRPDGFDATYGIGNLALGRSLVSTSDPAAAPDPADRKSTRLNSSHVEISYAVFCLKKKKNRTQYHIKMLH